MDPDSGCRDLKCGDVASSVKTALGGSVEAVSIDVNGVRVSKDNDTKSTESLLESGSGIFVGGSGKALEGGNGSFGECGGSGSGKEVLKGEMGGVVEVANPIESLDWVMKAAELLVSDGDVAESLELHLKNDLGNAGTLGRNSLGIVNDQKSGDAVAGQGSEPARRIRLRQSGDCVSGEGTNSSFQDTGVSYDSIIQDFFAQTPYNISANKETAVNDKNDNGKDLRMKKAKETLSKSSYRVSDLVWGKITSHPWWPGQISNPLDASELSMSHIKENCILVTYFGDGTFAWNEITKLKPFGAHFHQLENQSNVEAFGLAVDCALDEVGERIEYSLSCPCLPDAVYSGLRSQSIRNKGVHTLSRTRKTDDEYSDVAAFVPKNLVECVKQLAVGGLINRIDLVIAQSQLLALYRFKGYNWLPEFEVYDVGVDNETDILNTEMKKGQNVVIDDSDDELDVPTTKKRRQTRAIQKKKSFLCQFKSSVDDDDNRGSKAAASYGSSCKRRRRSGSEISLRKKQHSKTNLMAENFGSTDGGSTSTYESKESTTVAKKSSRKRVKTSGDTGKSVNGEDTMPPDEECVKGSYWTATVIKGKAEDQVLPEDQKANDRTAEVDDTDENSEESRPTALMLNFTDVDSVPSATNLNNIFTVYGPLIESKTEVQKKSKRAEVVFENHSDAEVAFSSAGKYSIFGPSLMSYRLKYLPSPQKRSSARVAKRGRKSSAESDSDTS